MKLTIGRRLALGFAVVTFIGVTAQLSLSNLDKNAAKLSEMIRDSQVGTSSQTTLLSLRMAVKDFLLSNSDEDYERYKTQRDQFLTLYQQSDENFQNPDRRAQLAEIQAKFDQYDQTFLQVTDIITQRNTLRDDVLLPTGRALRTNLQGYEHKLRDRGDHQRAVDAADATVTLMLARLYGQLYTYTTDQAALTRARAEIQNFSDQLLALRQDASASDAETLDQISADLETYESSLTKASKLVTQRNQLVLNTLDVLGPQIHGHWQTIVESLVADTNAIEEQTAQATSRDIAIVNAAIVFDVVLAALLAFFITRSITKPMNKTTAAMMNIAEGDGDLTVRLDDKRSDELGDLARGFNRFAIKVHDLVASVQGASHEVASASTEISATSDHISQGLTDQQRQVSLIAAAAEEMSTSVSEVANRASESLGKAKDAGDMATRGGEVVKQTIEDMQEIAQAVKATASCVEDLGKRSEQIGEIIEVINDIADQTNLLALNAAIEAARAGEHGRGFAVVADEVRKLADRTTKATEEIAQSIEAIQSGTNQAVERMQSGTERVSTGVERAGEAGRSLEAIVSGSQEVYSLVESIATSSREQSTASESVTSSVSEISTVIASSAEGSREASEAITMLSRKAEQLSALISKFKLHADDRRKNEGIVPKDIQNKRLDVKKHSLELMHRQGLDPSNIKH
ncbi:MAG: methyl-accepting chemotaxis protein [Phycisphaeraceae bacterium]